MRVAFFVPPPAQRVGGLDQAIDCLQQAISSDSWEILVEPSLPSGFDIAHFHGLWQPRFRALAAACEREGTPYVVSPHGMLEPWAWRHKWWKKWPYFYFSERQLLNSARSVLATSALERDNLRKFVRAPIIDIPLPITNSVGPDYEGARKELGFSDHEFVILYLSRIHPKKGLHLLLKALVDLSNTTGTIRLIVVGEGPPRYVASLQSLIADRNTRLPPIEFAGAVWDFRKWRYLQAADLLCLPTFSENFGFVILEACQVGTPALTTVHTPWPDFLHKAELPVAQATVPSLRHSLKVILTAGKWSQEKRQNLAQRAREVYGMEAIAVRFRDHYLSLLQPVSKIQIR